MSAVQVVSIGGGVLNGVSNGAEGVKSSTEREKCLENGSGSCVDTALNGTNNSGGTGSGGMDPAKSGGTGSGGMDTATSVGAGARDGPVTILISNGTEGTRAEEDACSPRAPSSASLHSEGIHASSSSSSFSLSCELSHTSSFNSKELLEQLSVDLNAACFGGEAIEKNGVVKQLLEHVISLKLELEELKQENAKLKGLRSTMDDELNTLTESLFEEAYKMVDTAKEEKGHAVKKLADAAGKIDAMETEMSALKNVLHATPPPRLTVTQATPSTSPHVKHRKPSVKKVLKKLGHKVKLSSKASLNSADSAIPLTLLEHKNEVKGACLGEGQMDPNEFLAFKDWLSDASQVQHPYLLKVMDQDILPCLNFSADKQMCAQVLTAVKSNELQMESLSSCNSEEKRVCVLSGCEDICCTHRMQLAPNEEWQFISQHCRDRIAAVCDFHMYLSHIQQGIIKLDASQLYWQVNRLRALMNLARLNLQLPD